jgi:hypothetical protein
MREDRGGNGNGSRRYRDTVTKRDDIERKNVAIWHFKLFT